MNTKLPPNINDDIDYSGSELRSIHLAGGCFWGVQAYMRRIKGVAFTEVGYANGSTADPSYREVCSMDTGHAETVHIKYDPEMVSLVDLLKEFFKVVDPTSFNRQGNDVGSQYRSGIFFSDPEDEQTIIRFMEMLAAGYRSAVVTQVKPLLCFYRAEEYHQSYLEKNPGGYCHISF